MLTWHQAISDPFFAKALLNKSLKKLFYKGPHTLLHYCMRVHASSPKTARVYLQKHEKRKVVDGTHNFG